MKKFLIRSLLVCACLLSLSFVAFAQKNKTAAKAGGDSTGVAVVKGTGKAAVVVVGSAAKVTWWITKLVANDVAKPLVVSVLKPVVTKAAPSVAKFAFKKSFKYLLPYAAKLSIL